MNPEPTPPDADDPPWPGLALQWIEARRTTLPKRLVAPGPSEAQLRDLFTAAAAAPDHGQLMPWRFIGIPADRRAWLGEVFVQALLERDPQADAAQQAQAREKAHRAPSLWLLVVDGACGDPEVPLAERILSAGCAVQNVMLMATAMGLGSALTSGKALASAHLREAFGLAPATQALCFLSLGTVRQARAPRPRPAAHDIVAPLDPGRGA